MATRRCPYCKGKGRIQGYYGKKTTRKINCPDCKGTGKQHQATKWVGG